MHSRLPRTARNLGNKIIKPLRFEFDRTILFGAHICRHEELRDLEPVVKVFFRLSSFEEAIYEIPVLALIAIIGRLVRNNRHKALLSVLLLDQILSGFACHPPAEEELDS